MLVAVQGTPGFQDYQTVLRAMGVALSSLKEDDAFFYIYTAGPSNINKMITEFVNLSERGMRARGKKIKMYAVPPSWIEENLQSINYFAFFSLPQERKSMLVDKAASEKVEFGIFQY